MSPLKQKNCRFKSIFLAIVLLLSVFIPSSSAQAAPDCDDVYTPIPESILQLIARSKAEYEQVSNEYDVPWELLAAIHYRESNLGRENLSNGQGVFQFLEKEGGPYPTGPVSDEEFLRQLRILGKQLQEDYVNYTSIIPNRRKMTKDETNMALIKDTLFSYNGRASVYARFAEEKYGFDSTTEPYEGSPYVMNRFDCPRARMSIISRDFGPVDAVDTRYGAFTLYARIKGEDFWRGLESGSGAASSVDNYDSDYKQPEEDKMCNTGTGFAGFLAFLICPLTALVLNATSFIQQNLIVPYLSVSPLQTDGAIYPLWESFRNIANILFIITFLIVIFSQATSIGISNYGVKRILPRLFVVAVGINLSFFIVSIAVDFFNVLGAGIADLVLASIPQVTGDDPGVAQSGISALVGVGALSVAAILSSAGAVLGWLWGLFVAAFIGIIVAMIVLILRQMMIIILVIISPLAFAAWLLPNTEQYFTRWRKLLTQLLVMYPLIILLFSVGKIFTAVINAGSYQITGGGGGAEGTAESVRVIFGFVASTAPLLLLPMAFTTAGTMISSIQNRLRKTGEKAAEKTNAELERRLKPRAKKLGYKLAQDKYNPKSENKALRALEYARHKTARGLGYASTIRERRDAKMANQETELNRQETEYLAKYARDSESFRNKATFGNKARADRILSRAESQVEALRREDIKAGESLYNNLLKKTSKGSKEFANENLMDYLKNGTDEVKDSNGNTVFKFSDNPLLMQSMLNRAAREGEVNAIEEARISPQLASADDQRMVDDVIADNKGAVIQGGGYHLTTGDPTKGLGYKAAIGRMEDSNGKLITDTNEMRQRIAKDRLTTMSNQGANSLAGWEWSMHEAAKNSLQGPSGQALLNSLSPEVKSKLKGNLDKVLDPNSDTYNKIENTDALKAIQLKLR